MRDVLRTSVGVVGGVYGDTTGLGPVVLLGLGLVEGAFSLESMGLSRRPPPATIPMVARASALTNFLAPEGRRMRVRPESASCLMTVAWLPEVRASDPRSPNCFSTLQTMAPSGRAARGSTLGRTQPVPTVSPLATRAQRKRSAKVEPRHPATSPNRQTRLTAVKCGSQTADTKSIFANGWRGPPPAASTWPILRHATLAPPLSWPPCQPPARPRLRASCPRARRRSGSCQVSWFRRSRAGPGSRTRSGALQRGNEDGSRQPQQSRGAKPVERLKRARGGRTEDQARGEEDVAVEKS